MTDKMPCSISDSNIQEPEDINPAVDYERDKDPFEAHAQAELDDKTEKVDSLQARTDAAFHKYFRTIKDVEVSLVMYQVMKRVFLEGCKFGIDELYKETISQKEK